MRQPVQQGGREMFLPHHALPVAKFQVGGDDDGDLLIKGRTLTNILQTSLLYSANSFR